MSINLTASFSHPDASAHRVRYARIDNTVTPVYTTVSPDPVSSPATIATNIPNGQYRVGYKPIYADGRSCEEQFQDTPACEGLISINAYFDGDNIVVQYLAPSDAPKVRITVNYPNGGSFTANYVNNGNDIPIAVPSNLFGDFFVTGQSVCDESSGFYSAPSSQVTISRSETSVTITNDSIDHTITSVTGIDGFSLSGNVAPGAIATGNHTAFFGSISVAYTPDGPLSPTVAQLIKNGTVIQCADLAGSPVLFSAASFAATDTIEIEFSIGTC